MITQIVIEYTLGQWYWDIYKDDEDKPLATGTAQSVESAVQEVSDYLRYENEE